MSRSRAGQHGEKTNQTLHTERVGLIKTFHTGGEGERKKEREKGQMRSVCVCGGGDILSLDTILNWKYQLTSVNIPARFTPAV